MKEQSRIPISKVQRASRFVSTGARVGGNFIKHYSKKIFNPELSRESLDQDNARDIYNSLSELKGSALKVAQMLSMDKNVLPTPFQDKFAMAQYSAPPLSYPLVVKTFHQYFGKSPHEIFDTFTRRAVNAASIGQVHQATLKGKKLAVKIQYPGVADSISSDLKIVKPMASTLFKIPSKDLNQFIGEVETRLLEETDYNLELKRSVLISQACHHLENVVFPQYYPEYSCERILVMDWIDGIHLKDFVEQPQPQGLLDRVGQSLWDFYDYQIHHLKQVHADPHPGNFIITPDNRLGIIDFGCVKEIPEDFYAKYFQFMRSDILENEEYLDWLFHELDFLFHDDTENEKKLFKSIFVEMLELLGQPFRTENFDFGNDAYFQRIFEVGERVSNMKEIRNSRPARGPKHGLYINRTYFGLYNILNDLKAKVITSPPKKAA